jgi:hypothetical protein
MQAIGQKGKMFNSFQAGGLDMESESKWRKSFAPKAKILG